MFYDHLEKNTSANEINCTSKVRYNFAQGEEVNNFFVSQGMRYSTHGKKEIGAGQERRECVGQE